MKKVIRLISIITFTVLFISILSVFCFAINASDIPDIATSDLDYEALFQNAYLINPSWDLSVSEGTNLSIKYRGINRSVSYNPTKHFKTFNEAYTSYMNTNPDIINDVPVFVFAPGKYTSEIKIFYSAIILGSNAGINPNKTLSNNSLDTVKNGMELNSLWDSENETVFSGGITRTTRGASLKSNGITYHDVTWSKKLTETEEDTEAKCHIRTLIDGVKITGGTGIKQRDYSNHAYNVLENGVPSSEYFTPEGVRPTTTALLNSVVDSFSGNAHKALFSANENSYNVNDIVMRNLRITNVSSNTLFVKYFRNLTADNIYYANSSAPFFGGYNSSDVLLDGSAFAGGSSTSAIYNQNISITNSMFYNITATNPISFGNTKSTGDFEKQTVTIENNIFYDAALNSKYGIFCVISQNTKAEVFATIRNNIIHQETARLNTLFNGNNNYQKSKTTILFNKNKVTGLIDCIYPNSNNFTEAFSTQKYFLDFNDNFYAKTPADTGTRSTWERKSKYPLASGYDFENCSYYLDYNFTTKNGISEIKSISGLGNNILIVGSSITADCSDINGTATPIIEVENDATATIYSDYTCTNKITQISIDNIAKTQTYYITVTQNGFTRKYTLVVSTGRYMGMSDISDISPNEFNFPVITVNTVNKEEIQNKEDYVACDVAISNTTDEYTLESKAAGIRFRGNSTYANSDKKAYRIKFDKKQNLFGMGKAKSWVLLANSFDKTMVRNTIAFAIGKALDLEFSSGYQYVQLYLNEEYKGLYLLCEQTQTGDNRVEVEEDETFKLDTGYLLEIAGNGRDGEDRWFTINEVDSSLFGNGVTANWRSSTIYAIIKTPELKYCSDKQVEFISTYFNNANKAILTQDFNKFSQYCDVESFAKFFIVNTILNNSDCGYQLYVYKKENGGKLYAGPIWDFDQSSASSDHGGSVYDRWYSGSKNPWFDSFSNWDKFMGIAKKIYIDHYDEIINIINYYTTEFFHENKYDYYSNDLRWDAVGNDYWRINDPISDLVTFEQNFEFLNSWFAKRIEWLDTQYNAVTIPATNIVISSTTLNLTKGQTSKLTATPLPDYADQKEISWVSSNSAVATVDQNGNVTALSNGTTTITAKVNNSDVFATCTIIVSKPLAATPSAPVISNYTHNTVTLVATDGYEYKLNDGNWQKSNIFSGLSPNTVYSFVCRVAETDTYAASEQSANTNIKTKSGISAKNFIDVKKSAWYYDYVDYVVEHGIFQGTSQLTFEPDTTVNRAMFVQALAKLEGVNIDNYVNTAFDDVIIGKWYTGAVKWASDAKIVLGTTNTTFEPLANISRQQMCVILVRYATYKNITIPSINQPKKFTDDSKISSYAKDAVYICQGSNIINGLPDNTFDPKGNATRSQVAKVFKEFHQNYIK